MNAKARDRGIPAHLPYLSPATPIGGVAVATVVGAAATAGRWQCEIGNRPIIAASLADDLFTPDYVLHMAGMPAAVDRNGIKQLPNVFGDAFNLTHAVDEIVAEGDTVAARWTVRGIHQGEFQGIAPTGKAVELSGPTIHHLTDGKIRESWVIFDSIMLLQQLGVVPGSAQSAA